MKSNNNKRIVFRGDGNHLIGLGHLYRLLALAKMIESEFECFFVLGDISSRNKNLIAEHFQTVVVSLGDKGNQLTAFLELIDSNDIVVLDGYEFSSGFQEQLKQNCRKLIIIDDLADRKYFADMIINHGTTRLLSKYRDNTQPHTKLLLGFDYLILRREFLAAESFQIQYKIPNSIFICFGGSDPHNLTCKVLKAGLDCGFVETITVVTGNAFEHSNKLKKIINKSSGTVQIIHKENLDGPQIAFEIGRSGIAICPSSTIALEVCSIKAGLITGLTADNQKYVLQELCDRKCCFSVGNFQAVSSEDIVKAILSLTNQQYLLNMTNAQAQLFDGHSAERIKAEFLQL